MFAGIITEIGEVYNIEKNDIYNLYIKIKKINNTQFFTTNNIIKDGMSIACSGICLTVKSFEDLILCFDVHFSDQNIGIEEAKDISAKIIRKETLKFVFPFFLLEVWVSPASQPASQHPSIEPIYKTSGFLILFRTDTPKPMVF